ncbi:MAG: Lipopolysaccharide assembly protein domain [Candidatus Parcubacteria bacterium]|jgi:uncharacterized integral membrane protein
MFIFLILGILLGALTVIFALQNVVTITVTFFTWHITGSLALILIVAVIAGLVMSTLVAFPGIMRNHFQLMSLRKQVKKLEEELAAQKSQTTTSAQAAVDSILS